MKKLLLCLSLLALPSCAMHFTHTDKEKDTKQNFAHDWNACRVKLNQAGMAEEFGARQFLQECMEGEGWERDK